METMCLLDLLRYSVLSLLLFVPVLWLNSGAFRFYVKISVYYLMIFVSSHIGFFFMLPNFGDINNYRIVRSLFLLFTNCFNIKWELRGGEHLKSDSPFVAICNHQSSLDFIGMLYIWPERCVCMVKSTIRYVGWFGVAADACGTVCVDRYNRERAFLAVESAVEQIKQKQYHAETDFSIYFKCKLWVFPEGTRNHSDGILPFKKGAFNIAVKAQIPIVPIVISSYNCFYSKKKKRFLSKGFAIIEALPSIPTVGLDQSDVTDLSVKAHKMMLSVYERISKEAEERYFKGDF